VSPPHVHPFRPRSARRTAPIVVRPGFTLPTNAPEAVLTSKSVSPQRYVAFLRAINVGGHVVKMDRLRALFAELGLAKVETFIASGNVIFEAPAGDAGAIETRIEEHLGKALGYAVGTFIRSTDEVAAAALHQPFPALISEPDSAPLYVGFLRSAPADEARQRVLALGTETDAFQLHGRELYWLSRTGIGKSPISGAKLEKALGMPTTLRNVTTVRNLAARYPPG
jgi:uncharacterized protein (DUF1697 family)